MTITTKFGEKDDGVLKKKEGLIDNSHETTTWVEYCLSSCADQVHRTGKPTQTHCWCPNNIHRSVSVQLNEGVGIESVLGSIG